MIKIPEDIISYIWEWIFSNKNMINIILCCKKFKQIGDKNGFLRHLVLDPKDDYIYLMQIWGRYNLKGLRSIVVNNFVNPSRWIPFQWPLHTYLTNCKFTSNIISPPLSPTTELRISEYNSKTKLNIDWEKLPQLKLLHIDNFDIDLTKLHICKKLQEIKINYQRIQFIWNKGISKTLNTDTNCSVLWYNKRYSVFDWISTITLNLRTKYYCCL